MVHSHGQKMRANYPIISQEFLEMLLFRANGAIDTFKMDKRVYSTFANTSHIPLSIYSILYLSDFNLDQDSTINKLQDYYARLKNAQNGIAQTKHINKEQRQRNQALIGQSIDYLQKIMAAQKTDKDEYHAYAKSVKEYITENLYDAAKEQLTQFLKQTKAWKEQYPLENWDELRVVILGLHQPRELYALKLFFQWLLQEPEYENRVVFAEFQFSVFGKDRIKARKTALKLLTQVDLDKEPSYLIFGDETYLQRDVMGPPAKQIIATWGEPDW